ncbi:hypothetical protein CLV43_119100 [Umezawaea tangerina]|uniref:Uncharacterized protein n=1 Tax=Umezawaea tangerina TaxID=84725 RepID=A0A2T0SK54_9PSEU|nr:hypothetical protein CLV43_119100 [Umezawaea tangerina]
MVCEVRKLKRPINDRLVENSANGTPPGSRPFEYVRGYNADGTLRSRIRSTFTDDGRSENARGDATQQDRGHHGVRYEWLEEELRHQ